MEKETWGKRLSERAGMVGTKRKRWRGEGASGRIMRKGQDMDLGRRGVGEVSAAANSLCNAAALRRGPVILLAAQCATNYTTRTLCLTKANPTTPALRKKDRTYAGQHAQPPRHLCDTLTSTHEPAANPAHGRRTTGTTLVSK